MSSSNIHVVSEILLHQAEADVTDLAELARLSSELPLPADHETVPMTVSEAISILVAPLASLASDIRDEAIKISADDGRIAGLNAMISDQIRAVRFLVAGRTSAA